MYRGRNVPGDCQYFLTLYNLIICGALRDLVPFVQFKKREKHPWRGATFRKIADFSLKMISLSFKGIRANIPIITLQIVALIDLCQQFII